MKTKIGSTIGCLFTGVGISVSSIAYGQVSNAPSDGAMLIQPVPSGDLDRSPVAAPSGDEGASSERTEECTLDDFVFAALTGHPALREASAKVGVAQGNAIQVGLPPNPMVFTSSPQWAGSVSQYNVVFGQDVITAGKLNLSRSAANRSVEQAQLDFTRTRFEVVTNVRTAFYAAAIAQKRTEVLAQLTEISAKTRDAARKLLQAGESNIADATLFDIEFDKAELSHRNSSTTLMTAKKQLAAAGGTPELEIGRLKFELSTSLPDYEFEVVRLGIVDRNAMAAIAAVEIRKSQIELRRATVEPWPNFNIQGGYQYGVKEPLHDQGYAQFTSSVPLWDRNQGGIQAAHANTVKAAAGLQRVENELSQEAADAVGRYVVACRRVKIHEEQLLPKTREVFRSNRLLYENGTMDVLRLLQAQRTLIETDLGYVEAQNARWTAAVTIAGLLQIEQFP